MTMAGIPADPWQADLLRSNAKRTLILASRQSGKSQVVAAKVLHEAIIKPKSLALLLSPTLRQSGELFREKLLPLWYAAGCPLKVNKPSQLELQLSNASRIVSLPESESNIRGFSGVTLLVIDEAARVTDQLYKATRAFLAVRDGSLIALSTPFGQRGWFYDAWVGQSPWQRVKITAGQCPRITKEFLEEERLELGTPWYLQEYECEFGSLLGALWEADYFPESIWYDTLPTSPNGDGVAWAPPVPNGILSIDTSDGKEKSDAQAFVYARYARDGNVYVEAEAHRLDDERLFNKAAELIEHLEPSHVVVETNGVGRILYNRLKRKYLALSIRGRYHNSSENKQVRIRARLTPFWSRGLLHFKRSPGTRKLIQEAQGFPLKSSPDDLLDGLELGLELAWELSVAPARRTVRYEM